MPGSGKGLLTDSGVDWAPSLCPSPAQPSVPSVLAHSVFTRAPRGRQGESLLTQEEALHSPTLCPPALLTPTFHTDSSKTDSSQIHSYPTYSALSYSAHTQYTTTDYTPTNSTTNHSTPNIPLSPCPPMPNGSRPCILNGSASGSHPVLTA